MKFDTPAGTNPIDQQKVVGKPHAHGGGMARTGGASIDVPPAATVTS